MSKSIAVPLAIVVAPVLAAAGILAVAGLGAAWAVKQGKQFYDGLSPEDRKFILPFGAERDRIQLQRAAVDYYPMEGFEFATGLPSFAITDDGAPSCQYLPTPTEAGAEGGFQQTQALERVESEAKALGFGAQRRQISSAADIIVLDLSAMAEARQNIREPILVR